MIQYPPLIDTIIPAFLQEEPETRVQIFNIYNPAISQWDWSSIWLRYRDTEASNNHWEYVGIDNGSEELVFQPNGKFDITFKIANMQTGFYYFQLAYSDAMYDATQPANLIYSTIAVGKCVSSLPTLSLAQISAHGVSVIGTEPTEGEKIYSYRFQVLDGDDNIIQTSEEIILPNNTPSRNILQKYFWKSQLAKKVQMIYTTINGYVGKTQCELALQHQQLPEAVGPPALTADNIAGAIDISNKRMVYTERALMGAEELEWETINNDKFVHYVDYGVASGQTYVYRNTSASTRNNTTILQISDNVSISINYDTMILQDQNRLLKLAFNPKVNSLKETVQETKQDTIGGRYPIFYRNANICYKEFPISGLISYLMDDEQQFLTNDKMNISA